jgi:ComF family protein
MKWNQWPFPQPPRQWLERQFGTWRGRLVVGRQTAWELARDSADLLFPPNCLVCSAPILLGLPHNLLLCPRCLDSFERLEPPLCLRCASPVRGKTTNQTTCARCAKRKYHFQGATAYGIYARTLREAVIRAKQTSQLPLAHVLGRLLAQHCATEPPVADRDIVLAMPTHWLRRFSRGGNSAETLAEEVAAVLQLPLLRRVIRLRRRTRKQGMLTPHERFRNVQHAFTLVGAKPLQGAKILLVDDVLTTGATASEVARVLKQGGAHSVHVAVVARGVGKD